MKWRRIWGKRLPDAGYLSADGYKLHDIVSRYIRQQGMYDILLCKKLFTFGKYDIGYYHFFFQMDKTTHRDKIAKALKQP
jgi:hypothetical protein